MWAEVRRPVFRDGLLWNLQLTSLDGYTQRFTASLPHQAAIQELGEVVIISLVLRKNAARDPDAWQWDTGYGGPFTLAPRLATE